jgi:hypothetical protein
MSEAEEAAAEAAENAAELMGAEDNEAIEAEVEERVFDALEGQPADGDGASPAGETEAAEEAAKEAPAKP